MVKMVVLATERMPIWIIAHAMSSPFTPAYALISFWSFSLASSAHQPAVVLLSCVPAHGAGPVSAMRVHPFK